MSARSSLARFYLMVLFDASEKIRRNESIARLVREQAIYAWGGQAVMFI